MPRKNDKKDEKKDEKKDKQDWGVEAEQPEVEDLADDTSEPAEAPGPAEEPVESGDALDEGEDIAPVEEPEAEAPVLVEEPTPSPETPEPIVQPVELLTEPPIAPVEVVQPPAEVGSDPEEGEEGEEEEVAEASTGRTIVKSVSQVRRERADKAKSPYYETRFIEEDKDDNGVPDNVRVELIEHFNGLVMPIGMLNVPFQDRPRDRTTGLTGFTEYELLAIVKRRFEAKGTNQELVEAIGAVIDKK